MSDATSSTEASKAEAQASPPTATPSERLERLRRLILQPTDVRLDEVELRFRDPERLASEIAKVLPQAVLLRDAQDDRLASSLAPTLEDALHTSIKDNPQPITDAIFPIIGPAIRKSISHAVSGLVENVNQTIESAFTVRGLRLRREARRTGRSYGEVLLAKSLVYRVEDVFLIHRETGLLLEHVHASNEELRDADLVSGMLTAIRDFVRDSFALSEEESLDQFRVGDLSVVVEQGPMAVAAAVVRGQTPTWLRPRLQEILEGIHVECRALLAAFEGESAPFQITRPLLATCLQSEAKEPEPPSPGRRALRVFVPAVAALLLVGLLGLSVRGCVERRAVAERVAILRARIAQEPGLSLMSAVRAEGEWQLAVAEDPEVVGRHAQLADEVLDDGDAVALRAFPMHLPHPEHVLARARRLLQPPEGVVLHFEAGLLGLAGLAPLAWTEHAERAATLLPGVEGLDAGGLVPTRWAELADPLRALRARVLTYTPGAERYAPRDLARIKELATALDQLGAQAKPLGARVVVRLRGASARPGRSRDQAHIDAARARTLRMDLEVAIGADVDLVQADESAARPMRAGVGAEDGRAHALALDVRLEPRVEGTTPR